MDLPHADCLRPFLQVCSLSLFSIPSLRLPMASARRSRSTYKSAAKSLKHVTAGGLEGVWDTKRCCVSLELPVGVTSIQMVVEGVD